MMGMRASTNMVDPETAILLAGADARILSEQAAPLLHRIAFLRSYQRQTGALSDIAMESLRSARHELVELLRGSSPDATSQP